MPLNNHRHVREEGEGKERRGEREDEGGGGRRKCVAK